MTDYIDNLIVELKFMGCVDNENLLPQENKFGDVYYVRDTEISYVWIGCWVNIIEEQNDDTEIDNNNNIEYMIRW